MTTIDEQKRKHLKVHVKQAKSTCNLITSLWINRSNLYTSRYYQLYYPQTRQKILHLKGNKKSWEQENIRKNKTNKNDNYRWAEKKTSENSRYARKLNLWKFSHFSVFPLSFFFFFFIFLVCGGGGTLSTLKADTISVSINPPFYWRANRK